MARLNSRVSTRPSSRFASETPAPIGPDKENRDPTARAKGKERAMKPPPSRTSLPTPTSEDATETSRGQKRKRVDLRSDGTQGSQIEQDEVKFVKWFDPNQDPEIRREIKRKSRALDREFHDNRDELLRDNGEGLTETLTTADRIFKHVKQTNDATLDSRLLVDVSDLAFKKTAQLVLGDTGTGVDVDEFLSKCITFMRNGGPSNREDDDAPSTARRRRTGHRNDVDDDEAAGETFDWEVLGRHACFPFNARPPVPSFLLGPLSVEKKQRTQTQRRAREAKDTSGREARPEALTKDDIQQSDENALTTMCTRIKRQLEQHVHKAEALMGRAGFAEEDVGTDRYRKMLKKCRLASDAGVSLFEFVLNPGSFGQTVENLFYISFLIREGSVGISYDDDELPTLHPAEATSLENRRKAETTKHQAVFAIDHPTWRRLVEAFEIREAMIEHRREVEPVQLGERGWYA